MTQFRFLLFLILFLAPSDRAEAWSCSEWPPAISENSQNAPTQQQLLRHHSIALSSRLPNTLAEGEKIVVGKFTRNTSTPFLHEKQLEDVRAMLWPPTEKVKMPFQIEYTYLDAYSFSGHKLEGSTLVQFTSGSVDLRVTISAEYEGIVDVLPTTEHDVMGVLKPGGAGRKFELTTSHCPSYIQIEPAQLSDLLKCYEEAMCR